MFIFPHEIQFFSCSVVSDSFETPMDGSLPNKWDFLSMGFSRQDNWSGLPCPPPGDLPNPGIELKSLTLQADSLPSELPGKPKNTEVDSLSLLQGIFLTQEFNQCLLHCRWILYQLRYQKSHHFQVVQFIGIWLFIIFS